MRSPWCLAYYEDKFGMAIMKHEGFHESYQRSAGILCSCELIVFRAFRTVRMQVESEIKRLAPPQVSSAKCVVPNFRLPSYSLGFCTGPCLTRTPAEWLSR